MKILPLAGRSSVPRNKIIFMGTIWENINTMKGTAWLWFMTSKFFQFLLQLNPLIWSLCFKRLTWSVWVKTMTKWTLETETERRGWKCRKKKGPRERSPKSLVSWRARAVSLIWRAGGRWMKWTSSRVSLTMGVPTLNRTISRERGVWLQIEKWVLEGKNN